MVITLAVASFGRLVILTKAETSMILALRDRNIPVVRKLMQKQVSLLTVVPNKDPKVRSEMPENYIVGAAQFDNKSSDAEIKINLERLSKMISFSLSKPALNPRVLNSAHNDLTRNTIRGSIAPQVYWELHYDIGKGGSLRLQRICEFDHSPKFVW